MGSRNNRSRRSDDGRRPHAPQGSSPTLTCGRGTSQGYYGHWSNSSHSSARARAKEEFNNGPSSASPAGGSAREDLRHPFSLCNFGNTKTQVNAVSLRETFRAQDYFRDSQRSPEEPMLCQSGCGKPVSPSMIYFHNANSCYSRGETPPTYPGSSQSQLPTSSLQFALPPPPPSTPLHFHRQQQQRRQYRQEEPSRIAMKLNSPPSTPIGAPDESRPNASAFLPMARTSRQAVVEDQLRRIGRPVLISQHRCSFLQGPDRPQDASR